MNKFNVFRHLSLNKEKSSKLHALFHNILSGSPYFRLVNSHMTRIVHTSQSWLLSWCVLEYFMAVLPEQDDFKEKKHLTIS